MGGLPPARFESRKFMRTAVAPRDTESGEGLMARIDLAEVRQTRTFFSIHAGGLEAQPVWAPRPQSFFRQNAAAKAWPLFLFIPGYDRGFLVPPQGVLAGQGGGKCKFFKWPAHNRSHSTSTVDPGSDTIARRLDASNASSLFFSPAEIMLCGRGWKKLMSSVPKPTGGEAQSSKNIRLDFRTHNPGRLPDDHEIGEEKMLLQRGSVTGDVEHHSGKIRCDCLETIERRPLGMEIEDDPDELENPPSAPKGKICQIAPTPLPKPAPWIEPVKMRMQLQARRGIEQDEIQWAAPARETAVSQAWLPQQIAADGK